MYHNTGTWKILVDYFEATVIKNTDINGVMTMMDRK